MTITHIQKTICHFSYKLTLNVELFRLLKLKVEFKVGLNAELNLESNKLVVELSGKFVELSVESVEMNGESVDLSNFGKSCSMYCISLLVSQQNFTFISLKRYYPDSIILDISLR